MERNEIFTAKTFDEAKQKAAETFGVDELDINFEIIEQPKKGLFGTKGEFRVRAICTETASSSESVSASATTSETDGDLDPAQFERVSGYIGKILEGMGIENYKLNIKKVDDNNVIDITGDNLGIIIGRRGETLDALQYLAILTNNRNIEEKHPRLIIDCNGYREKRADTLEALAIRTSAKVIKQGRRITLEAMNPYERRVIHSKVASIDGVYSSSIGNEPYRKVVISAEMPKRRSFGDRDNRDNRDSRDSRNRERRGGFKESSVVLTHTPGEVSNTVKSQSYKKSEGFSTSFERDYKRAAAPEISQDTVDMEKSASLYGKIEL